MELSQEQIDLISRFVIDYDIKSYIKAHQDEYEKFLEQEKNKL